MATSLEQRPPEPESVVDAQQPAPPVGHETPGETAARLVKPRLRGWLHAAITPLACAAGIVLICLAPTAAGKVGGAVFLAAALLLFGTSALFHRFNWGVTGVGILRRLDHSNIYLFIAASYTPFALGLLEGRSQTLLLVLIWGAAVLGLFFRTFWLSAPRWLYTLLYVVVGLSPAGWMPQFAAHGGPAVFTLILVGGGLYVAGAIIYATKRPDPSPRWFGFHEVFHSCTIGAFVSHYIAISMVTYAA
ncbi:PAQR family membrane homeostasis protein TrhA [Microlunatus soli]|uniref:Hemolysin III n=1 Tax=Microlunatus soli TaxID=630515 RepID=A0A1H1QHF6_9ACTN|nr:hemolysin III family protein [Microlunatus soli]SDS22757.1 hemolysin III [Microlunatus soli]